MKNGFTLIELLAVIVILAIIALIAVPIVLNIINDSKESSLLRSAEFYLSAAEYTIADAFLYHGGLEDKEYPIDINGDICKIELDNQGNCPKTGDKSNTLKVEVNGEKPTGGSITIESGNISDVSLILDEKTIIKNPDGELVYQVEKPCTLAVDDNSNGQIDIGDKITCKTESFYVVSNDGTNVEMLTEKNINVTGSGDIKQMDNAGTIVFARSAYFFDNESIKSIYQKEEKGSGEYHFFPDSVYYIYDENSMPYSYVSQYEEFLSDYVDVLDIKLLSFSKFINIAQYDSVNYVYTSPAWILGGKGEYLLGSCDYYGGGYDNINHLIVKSSSLTGDNASPDRPTDSNSGVRPVVTISINNIKTN